MCPFWLVALTFLNKTIRNVHARKTFVIHYLCCLGVVGISNVAPGLVDDLFISYRFLSRQDQDSVTGLTIDKCYALQTNFITKNLFFLIYLFGEKIIKLKKPCNNTSKKLINTFIHLLHQTQECTEVLLFSCACVDVSEDGCTN